MSVFSVFTPLRRVLRRFGYDIVRIHLSATARRMLLLERYQIDLVLDIGANIGQYATTLREAGYRGRIVSFEPVSASFATLQQKAKSDPNWQVVQLALGDFDGDTVINVAVRSVNNSLFPLREPMETVNPTAHMVGQEKITVRRLDTIASQYLTDNARIFLKSDTQGFEKNVLQGAQETLKRVLGVQLEMSFVPLYNGETSMLGLLQELAEQGFTLMSTEHTFSDLKTGRQYQMDGIFFREPFPRFVGKR